MKSGSELLKTDKRGRVWRSRQQREQLLDEFGRSGLSGAKFASLVGVNYQTFAGWLHNRRNQRTQIAPVPSNGTRSPVQWFETVVDKPSPAGSSALIVRLPSGATVEVGTVSQASLAGAVLRAWEKASC